MRFVLSNWKKRAQLGLESRKWRDLFPGMKYIRLEFLRLFTYMLEALITSFNILSQAKRNFLETFLWNKIENFEEFFFKWGLEWLSVLLTYKNHALISIVRCENNPHHFDPNLPYWTFKSCIFSKYTRWSEYSSVFISWNFYQKIAFG